MAKTAEEKREYQREAQRRWRAAHPEYKERAKEAERRRRENMSEAKREEYIAKERARSRRRFEANKDEYYLNAARRFASYVGCIVVPDPAIQHKDKE